jgi:hypothetical protein
MLDEKAYTLGKKATTQAMQAIAQDVDKLTDSEYASQAALVGAVEGILSYVYALAPSVEVAQDLINTSNESVREDFLEFQSQHIQEENVQEEVQPTNSKIHVFTPSSK